MGARAAPSVAQLATWTIVLPVLELPGVRVVTMIDNVRIVCSDPTIFTSAVRLFLRRCDLAGVTVNEHQFTGNSEHWPEIGKRIAAGSDFLGEHHTKEGVGNTDRLLTRLGTSYAR